MPCRASGGFQKLKSGGGGDRDLSALNRRRNLLLLFLLLNMFSLSPCSISPARVGRYVATEPEGGTVSPIDGPAAPTGCKP